MALSAGSEGPAIMASCENAVLASICCGGCAGAIAGGVVSGGIACAATCAAAFSLLHSKSCTIVSTRVALSEGVTVEVRIKGGLAGLAGELGAKEAVAVP